MVDFDAHLATGTADILCRTLDPAFLYATVAATGTKKSILFWFRQSSLYPFFHSDLRSVLISTVRRLFAVTSQQFVARFHSDFVSVLISTVRYTVCFVPPPSMSTLSRAL